jgi:hypothetical protein
LILSFAVIYKDQVVRHASLPCSGAGVGYLSDYRLNLGFHAAWEPLPGLSFPDNHVTFLANFFIINYYFHGSSYNITAAFF